jgi:hypothetical protein
MTALGTELTRSRRERQTPLMAVSQKTVRGNHRNHPLYSNYRIVAVKQECHQS